MQTLTETIVDNGLAERILSEEQLERIVGGDPGRRYGLVNRALKARELIRIRRGIYVLAEKFREQSIHPFAIAQAISPGSYVSFETALSSHGWIPEGVEITASVVSGRKSSAVEHPVLGSFSFHPLALHRLYFLELIERQKYGSHTAFVARPVRALMDLVCLRKAQWQGLDWLTDSLRIDEQTLRGITRKELQALARVYKQSRPIGFLKALAEELDLD